MRELKSVNAEIKEILATNTRELKKHAISKLRKRVEFLEVVRNYLESSPDELFVKQEKSRIEKLVQKISDEFSAWLQWNKDKGNDYKEQRAYYEKETDLKKYKTQFKALDFILS